MRTRGVDVGRVRRVCVEVVVSARCGGVHVSVVVMVVVGGVVGHGGVGCLTRFNTLDPVGYMEAKSKLWRSRTSTFYLMPSVITDQ